MGVKSTLVALAIVGMTHLGSSQINVDNYQRKLNRYFEVSNPTHIYFLFNQPRYVAGDTAYFTAFFLQTENTRVSGKHLMEVFVVHESGEITDRFLFTIADGTGANQWVIPENVKPGHYAIWARTGLYGDKKQLPSKITELLVVENKVLSKNEVDWEQNPVISILEDHDQLLISIAKQDEDASLLLVKNGKIRFATNIKQGKPAESNIPLADISGGLNQLVLLSKRHLIAEVRFYKKESILPEIRVESVATPRSTAKINVTLCDQSGQPISGFFTARVLNETFFQLRQEKDGINWLEQHLGLKCHENSSICKVLNELAPSIPWEQLLINGEIPEFTASRFLELEGQATVLETGLPLPPNSIIFFYFQNSTWRNQIAMTNSNGSFKMKVPDLYQDDRVIYAARDPLGSPLAIQIFLRSDSSSSFLPAPKAHFADTKDSLFIFRQKVLAIEESYQYSDFSLAASSENPTEPMPLESELGGADLVFEMEDYIPFDQMEQMVIEVIRPLFIVTEQNWKQVLVRNMNPPATQEPLFIIDGEAIQGSAYFLSLDPRELKSIRIITNPRKLLKLGMLSQNGIVLVQSKKSNLGIEQQGTLYLTGIQKPIDFPQFSNGTPHPVFRSTAFWISEIKTDKEGKAQFHFTLPDDPTNWWLQIDGMSDSGIPFSSSILICEPKE